MKNKLLSGYILRFSSLNKYANIIINIIILFDHIEVILLLAKKLAKRLAERLGKRPIERSAKKPLEKLAERSHKPTLSPNIFVPLLAAPLVKKWVERLTKKLYKPILSPDPLVTSLVKKPIALFAK